MGHRRHLISHYGITHHYYLIAVLVSVPVHVPDIWIAIDEGTYCSPAYLHRKLSPR